MAIFAFILMLDPARAMAPPPAPSWSAKKVEELKKIDFGIVVTPQSIHFDPVTHKVRELEAVFGSL